MLKTLLRSNKKLALILLKTQRDVFSNIIGNNPTKVKGDGYDFVELREYESGDDIRHIDWIISSKIGKPYVKLFAQERELNVVIVPIMSGSLYFGVRVFKKDFITQICALISYSCIKQNDPFESYICSDEVKLCTQKTKQIFGVRTLVEKIDAFHVLGKKANYSLLTQGLYQNLKQPSMVFLIGDFFDTQELNLKALSVKHELIAIIIRERFEENPSPLDELNIVDPSLQKSAKIILNKQTLKAYSKKVEENDEKLYKKFQMAGVRFIKIYTDEDPASKIISLMSTR